MVSITSKTMSDEIRRQQRLSAAITDLQSQISSTKKISSPSQDPQTWVQVSEIGRSQSQQAAWQANASYGAARAKKAEDNLAEMNTLFSRARELLVTASTGSSNAPSKAAIVAEIQGIQASMNELLNEKDYQGTPVFDDTNPTLVPVLRGINLEAVGTRQSVSEGVNLGSSTSTLDAILSSAIAAVQSGNSTTIQGTLTDVEKGLDHIIVAQSVQGIRSDRLENATNSLTETDLSLAEQRSKLEDTDLTTAIATLQSKLTTLEAAQAAFARINRQNLFDLLN